jgi:hypothetical protein
MRTRAILTTLAVLSFALFLSCGEDSVTETGPEYSRATPEDLIDALAYSMEHKDIGVYDECLHDEYIFVFMSEDTASLGLPPDEPWWGRTQDISAMSRLFADSNVVSIECGLVVEYGPWPTDDGLGYRLDPNMKFTIDGGAQEDTTLWVFASWLYIEVVPDPYAAENWVFKEIEEMPKAGSSTRSAPGSGEMATEAATFGSVKARYK